MLEGAQIEEDNCSLIFFFKKSAFAWEQGYEISDLGHGQGGQL